MERFLYLPRVERMVMNHFKGIKRRPTLCSRRTRPPERGIAYRFVKNPGRRSAHSTSRAGKLQLQGRGTVTVTTISRK